VYYVVEVKKSNAKIKKINNRIKKVKEK